MSWFTSSTCWFVLGINVWHCSLFTWIQFPLLRICVSIACRSQSTFLTNHSIFLHSSCSGLIMLCGAARNFISFCGINALFHAFSVGLIAVIKILMTHHSLTVTLTPMLIFTALNANFPPSKDSSELTMNRFPCDNVHFHSEFVSIGHSFRSFLPKHFHKLYKLIICAYRSLSHQFCFSMF